MTKDSERMEVIISPEMAEKFRACRKEEFPICLQNTLVDMFADKDTILSIAEKTGLKNRKVSTSSDIFELYLDVLSSLYQPMGEDAVSVLEYRALKEMESLGCKECPLYDLELKRKAEKYSKPI